MCKTSQEFLFGLDSGSDCPRSPGHILESMWAFSKWCHFFAAVREGAKKHGYVRVTLGKPVHSKADQFSEKFRTTVDLPPRPPHFWKIMLRIFFKIHDQSTPL